MPDDQSNNAPDFAVARATIPVAADLTEITRQLEELGRKGDDMGRAFGKAFASGFTAEVNPALAAAKADQWTGGRPNDQQVRQMGEESEDRDLQRQMITLLEEIRNGITSLSDGR